ncbi:hypothetical protein EJB05_30269, partial [Eragrostis curvula]
MQPVLTALFFSPPSQHTVLLRCNPKPNSSALQRRRRRRQVPLQSPSAPPLEAAVAGFAPSCDTHRSAATLLRRPADSCRTCSSARHLEICCDSSPSPTGLKTMAGVAPLPVGRLYCPDQPTLADVPVLPQDIFGGVDNFNQSQDIMRQRQDAISPFFVAVGGRLIATTPLKHPRKLSSHHIHRLLNSRQNPLYRRFFVDLFIRDTDLYVVAFRRGIILPEAEIVAGVDGVIWGRACISTGGGDIPMMNMFYALASFETKRLENDQFQWAVNCVIATFIEPRRLRCMDTEMSRRIEHSTDDEELPSFLWKMIHAWGSLSALVLIDRVRRCLSLTNALPHWCQEDLNLSFTRYLLGPEGELLLLKLNKAWLDRTDEQLEKLENDLLAGNVPIPNPMFVIPQERVMDMAALMDGLI